jgi:glycosyltransferase involved in cell wall biosynthesis
MSAGLTTLPRLQTAAPQCLGVRAVLLTGYIPPHLLPFYTELATRIDQLVILVSTAMESQRSWRPDFGELDVRRQRTWSLRRWRSHPIGTGENIEVHFPYDTVSQLRRLSPDVIIASQFGMRSLMSAAYTRLFRRVPLVISVNLSQHTEQGRGWRRAMLRRWLVKQADALTVNGESGRRYLESIGADAVAIHIVPYTHVQGVFEDLPRQRHGAAAHRMIFAGRLIDLKGLMPYLEALARCAARRPQQQIEFQLAGSGPLREKLQAFQGPANLQVKLLGELSFPQLASAYGQAGIAVLPTLTDEWGMTVNEAMLAGLPVLGSLYSQAVEELVDEGTTGWAFRTDHTTEIEDAIEAALDTPEEQLNHMRQLARARVADITPKSAASRMVAAIKAAIESSANRRQKEIR